MTVGNEEYGSWETDNHTLKNNAATYAAATAGSSGYYALIKAASPSTLVGVIRGTPAIMLGVGSDGARQCALRFRGIPLLSSERRERERYLPGASAAQELTTNINTIKSELATAGKPNTPIYVGEMGSGSSAIRENRAGRLRRACIAGQMLGEMMNDGVSRLTWWIGFGNCNGTAGNDSSSLYGWQDFGAYNVFSDGPAIATCPNGGSRSAPCLLRREHFSSSATWPSTANIVLTATTTGDTTNVRAYAATHSGGTALVLFNLNENASAPVTITLSGRIFGYRRNGGDLRQGNLRSVRIANGNFPGPVGTSTWAAPSDDESWRANFAADVDAGSVEHERGDDSVGETGKFVIRLVLLPEVLHVARRDFADPDQPGFS